MYFIKVINILKASLKTIVRAFQSILIFFYYYFMKPLEILNKAYYSFLNQSLTLYRILLK